MHAQDKPSRSEIHRYSHRESGDSTGPGKCVKFFVINAGVVAGKEPHGIWDSGEGNVKQKEYLGLPCVKAANQAKTNVPLFDEGLSARGETVQCYQFSLFSAFPLGSLSSPSAQCSTRKIRLSHFRADAQRSTVRKRGCMCTYSSRPHTNEQSLPCPDL